MPQPPNNTRLGNAGEGQALFTMTEWQVRSLLIQGHERNKQTLTRNDHCRQELVSLLK